jgi:hypothetical protein
MHPPQLIQRALWSGTFQRAALGVAAANLPRHAVIAVNSDGPTATTVVGSLTAEAIVVPFSVYAVPMPRCTYIHFNPRCIEPHPLSRGRKGGEKRTRGNQANNNCAHCSTPGLLLRCGA